MIRHHPLKKYQYIACPTYLPGDPFNNKTLLRAYEPPTTNNLVGGFKHVCSIVYGYIWDNPADPAQLTKSIIFPDG